MSSMGSNSMGFGNARGGQFGGFGNNNNNNAGGNRVSPNANADSAAADSERTVPEPLLLIICAVVLVAGIVFAKKI